MSIHENNDVRVPINTDSVSIQRDPSKCILCGACRSVCKFQQGVYGKYDLEKTGDTAICIECGQCTNVCPTNAITEVKDYLKLKEMMKDPDKVFVFQTAPSVRVALGEEFGFELGSFVQGKMVAALHELGAHYVFDTAYGADLTIMEEANELLKRIDSEDHLPMFTSCCPAWVKFAEMFYPELLPNLSTCKSPISMLGSIIKTYFSDKKNIDPSKIVNVAVTPCTAKKYEIKREEMNDAGIYHENNSMRDIDFVITTRELASWLREEHIDFASLEDREYDSILGEATGAGVIFGSTGGVMEAAIRTAYYYAEGEKMPETINLNPIRGLEGIKETTVKIGDHDLHIAVVTGTMNAHKFIKMLKETDTHYDFVEVMACLGGCVAGGGQPKVEQTVEHLEREKRAASLYQKDILLSKRNSYENAEIQELYRTFLKTPGSDQAELLLHTTYQAKDHLLDVEKTSVS